MNSAIRIYENGEVVNGVYAVGNVIRKLLESGEGKL